MLIAAAHQNEEFAEQLARLCSTLTNKPNAIKACEDVIKQYQVCSRNNIAFIPPRFSGLGDRCGGFRWHNRCAELVKSPDA
jgi:hypothetical protein